MVDDSFFQFKLTKESQTQWTQQSQSPQVFRPLQLQRRTLTWEYTLTKPVQIPDCFQRESAFFGMCTGCRNVLRLTLASYRSCQITDVRGTTIERLAKYVIGKVTCPRSFRVRSPDTGGQTQSCGQECVVLAGNNWTKKVQLVPEDTFKQSLAEGSQETWTRSQPNAQQRFIPLELFNFVGGVSGQATLKRPVIVLHHISRGRTFFGYCPKCWKALKLIRMIGNGVMSAEGATRPFEELAEPVSDFRLWPRLF